MLLLILIPVLLYYLLYFAEYLYWVICGKGWENAYDFISFEQHAYWIDETWNYPCDKKHHYVTFGWWLENFGDTKD